MFPEPMGNAFGLSCPDLVLCQAMRIPLSNQVFFEVIQRYTVK